VLQLVQAHERHARRDARKPFAHQHDVRAHVVFGDDVGETAFVHVGPFAVALEADPAVQHERRQPIARCIREGRRRVEDAADFRRVDAKQPHAAVHADVDRVAVDDVPHEHQL